ncbi:FAGR274Cp [Eremothecium gossypii FDAG1]|nr:FAGR274Cp [Eremothecium gossypii FDAG1]
MCPSNAQANEDPSLCLIDLTFMKQHKGLPDDPSFVELAINGILNQDSIVAQRKVKFSELPLGPQPSARSSMTTPRKSILVSRQTTETENSDNEEEPDEVELLLHRCFNFCNLDTDGVAERPLVENLELISYGIISTFRFHECCYKYAHELEASSTVKEEVPQRLLPVDKTATLDTDMQDELVLWKIEAEELGIKNNVLMTENGKLIAELTALRQTIRTLNDEKEKLRAQVHDRDIQLLKLKDQSKDIDTETQVKLRRLQDLAGRLEKVISQRASTISNLREDRQALRRELAKSTELTINLKGDNRRLKAHVDSLLHLFNDCENEGPSSSVTLPHQLQSLKLTSKHEKDESQAFMQRPLHPQNNRKHTGLKLRAHT